jgi:prepilin-type N-terminal cleavage/methylation domain-containing protein
MDAMSRNRTGFTLLELLIVIVMIGILLAMAMPKLNKVDAQASTSSAVRVIAGQLATARAAAIHSGYDARMTIGGSSIQVETSDSLGTFAPFGKMVDLAELGVTVSVDPESEVVFDSRGFAVGIDDMQRFIVDAGTYGVPKDTVCVARLGLVLPNGCNL